MIRVGIVNVDKTNFPNLALMKVSAYWKRLGAKVELADPLFGHYDLLYKSKVFTFTPDDNNVYHADEIRKGGTGYNMLTPLPEEIDRLQPDYSLFNVPADTAYGFLTRGCVNHCPWCVVPKKEGNIHPYMDIEEISGGVRKKLILMDNNVLASDHGLRQIEIAAEKGYYLDFNQGLEPRLITPEVAQLLARCKWLKYIRTACDSPAQIPDIKKAVPLLRKYGYKKDIFVYCLLRDFEESYERVRVLWEMLPMGVYPFCQPYRDFHIGVKQIIPQWQKDMAHWVNRKWYYKSCWFDDFVFRNGFCGGMYKDPNYRSPAMADDTNDKLLFTF